MSDLKIHEERIFSKALEGNKPGDPAERSVTVVEYNAGEVSPVIIGLAGFYGTSFSFMNRSFTSIDFISTLEKMVSGKKVDSFIIVLPDTMTSFGGNQYVDSTAVGNYETFITRDLMGFIRNKYGKRNIGLFGKSSGGFGSYNLSIKNPGLFKGFIDVSGDSGFEYCYLRDFPQAIDVLGKTGVTGFLEKYRKSDFHTNQDLNVNGVIAMSAFYSPAPDEEMGIRLPFETSTGELREDVWRKWKKLDPIQNARDSISELKKKKIILQTGSRDEFSINIGMRGLSRILKDNGVDHHFTEYDAGHFGIDYFYEESLPELINGIRD